VIHPKNSSCRRKLQPHQTLQNKQQTNNIDIFWIAKRKILKYFATEPSILHISHAIAIRAHTHKPANTPTCKQTHSTTVETDKQQRRSKQVAYSLYSIPITFDTSHDLKSLLKELAPTNTTKQRRKERPFFLFVLSRRIDPSSHYTIKGQDEQLRNNNPSLAP
jgi:hypothetical protein